MTDNWCSKQIRSLNRCTANAEKKKFPELSAAIQRCGVEDRMVVDVLPVRVRCHYKGVLALGKAHGQFVAHLVSFLCGDFPPDGRTAVSDKQSHRFSACVRSQGRTAVWTA